MAERNRPGDAGDPSDDEVFADGVDDAKDVPDDDADEPVGRGGTALAERTPKSKKDVRRRGPFGRIGGFFREVVSELRKVIWPTRKELLTYTSVVIVFVVVVTAIVSGLDYVFGKGILWALG